MENGIAAARHTPPALSPIHIRIADHIEEHGIKQKWVAEKLGETDVWLSYALRGLPGKEFTAQHIETLERLWNVKL